MGRKKAAPRTAVPIAVRRDESMGLYGAWAGIPMEDLYRRVGLRWNETLAVGRRLLLPMTERERLRFEEARARLQRHREKELAAAGVREVRVRRGDNPWRIARRLGVPLWAIERLNPGRDISRLKVGEKLRVPARPTGES